MLLSAASAIESTTRDFEYGFAGYVVREQLCGAAIGAEELADSAMALIDDVEPVVIGVLRGHKDFVAGHAYSIGRGGIPDALDFDQASVASADGVKVVAPVVGVDVGDLPAFGGEVLLHGSHGDHLGVLLLNGLRTCGGMDPDACSESGFGDGDDTECFEFGDSLLCLLLETLPCGDAFVAVGDGDREVVGEVLEVALGLGEPVGANLPVFGDRRCCHFPRCSDRGVFAGGVARGARPIGGDEVGEGLPANRVCLAGVVYSNERSPRCVPLGAFGEDRFECVQVIACDAGRVADRTSFNPQQTQ